ncbi:hypothetical protein ABJB18_01455 [Bifidobacterium bifidum]|nr:hypothetical protein [Bifidobacterium bifidum]MCC8306768.1 hypothetical protein [Bifidobacterium bifidum]
MAWQTSYRYGVVQDPTVVVEYLPGGLNLLGYDGRIPIVKHSRYCV